MVTVINYSDIAHLTPTEAAVFLRDQPKFPFWKLKVSEVLLSDKLNQNLCNSIYQDIFMKGLYLFANDNDQIRYLGKSRNGFYFRMMSQLSTEQQGPWGWNAFLRKLGGERLQKAHEELTKEDHDFDYNVMIAYQFLLVNTETLSKKQIDLFERLMLKAFRELQSENTSILLNTRVGWLSESEKKSSLKALFLEDAPSKSSENPNK